MRRDWSGFMIAHILTQYEVHQIAFLTQNGWVCSDRGVWTKPGKDGEFDLDGAYWEEMP